MLRQMRDPIFRQQPDGFWDAARPRRWTVASDGHERAAEVLSRQGNIDSAGAVVAEFCLAVPALRVTPTHSELERLWERCALLPVQVVASALCDLLSSASVEQVWQPALRALHVIVHFHAKAAMGKSLVHAVLAGAGGDFVRHLATEVPECQLVARNVLLLRKAADHSRKHPTEEPRIEEPAVEQPVDLIDFVEHTSSKTVNTDAAIAVEGCPFVHRACIAEDLISMDDPPLLSSLDFVHSLHNPLNQPRPCRVSVEVRETAKATTSTDFSEAISSCHRGVAATSSRCAAPCSESARAPNPESAAPASEPMSSASWLKGYMGYSSDLSEVLKACPTTFVKTFDISDGDPGKDNSDLFEMFSFRRRDTLIKHFPLLVASSKDSTIDDPFAFVADHVDNMKRRKDL